MKIVEPSVEVLQHTTCAEQLIEHAGRTCYKSEDRITPDSSPDFIERLLKSGHLSVLEHASATIKIIADRGFTHELVRHRIGSYSQESTRYCRYGDEISVILPLDIIINYNNQDDHLYRSWYDAVTTSEREYLEMLGRGATPETARSVLPICLKTEIVVTFNFRQWRYFIKLRSSPKAHPMMRKIVGMILEELIKISPTCFGDLSGS